MFNRKKKKKKQHRTPAPTLLLYLLLTVFSVWGSKQIKICSLVWKSSKDFPFTRLGCPTAQAWSMDGPWAQGKGLVPRHRDAAGYMGPGVHVRGNREALTCTLVRTGELTVEHRHLENKMEMQSLVPPGNTDQVGSPAIGPQRPRAGPTSPRGDPEPSQCLADSVCSGSSWNSY